MNTSRIISTIKSNGIVVMPTDTLYGIVGSAFSKKAVERIYSIKGRNPKKPLIVLISKISDLRKFGVKEIPKELKHVWPNPITVILPTKRFSHIHRGSNSIAFRIPKDKKLLKLLAKTGPLVAPSANPEGKAPARNIKEAKKYFGNKIDLYVGKARKFGSPSTIIKWQMKKWRIVRNGSISSEKLKYLLQSKYVEK